MISQNRKRRERSGEAVETKRKWLWETIACRNEQKETTKSAEGRMGKVKKKGRVILGDEFWKKVRWGSGGR